MTIDEAIEMLNSILRDRREHKGSYGNQALKLGIKALERVVDARGDAPLFADTPLPGETEE